jgi:myo-inositol-1(or 4)-monophosphatase
MTKETDRVLETALLAARTGGQMALARLDNPGYEKRKGPRDLTSGGILEIQAAIVDVIRQEFPDAHFLLEESDGPQDETADPLWIIDPIDGSLNFLHGIPIFAVCIAYRQAGVYHVGVVYDPCRDEMFHAVRGGHAYLNGHSIFVDSYSDGREAWKRAVVGTDWRGNDEEIRKALQLARYVAAETFQVIALGAPSLGLCYVARGRLHAYYGLEALKLWDVAAGAVILLEAGGVLTNIEGTAWQHGQGGYIASNNVIHGWLHRVSTAVLGLHHKMPQSTT